MPWLRTSALEPYLSDTLPYGNRFHVPFTREEMTRALLLTLPDSAAVSQIVDQIYSPDQETTGVAVTDGTLLVLAALSDDVARRVIAYRPSLTAAVEKIRADPEAFTASLPGRHP
jgi:hypothetical protein